MLDRRVWALPCWMLALGACTIAEEDFPDRAADAACDRVEECTTVFEDESERTDCETFWRAFASGALETGAFFGAEYDPAAGAECVRDVRSASCAEFNDGAFDCDIFADDDEG